MTLIRRRSSSSRQQTGIKVNYFEEINDNAEYFAKVQGPLSQGDGIDRDIFVLTDNSRFPGTTSSTRAGSQELDKEPHPEHREPRRRAGESAVRPEPRVLAAVAVSGMTGIAWNEDVTGPVTTVQQLLEDPKLKGKVTMLQEMADSVGLVMLQNGDDPAKVTDESFNRAISTRAEGGRLRADPAVHGQRLRPAADEGRPRRVRSRGPATSCSCSRTTRSSSGQSPRRAG